MKKFFSAIRRFIAETDKLLLGLVTIASAFGVIMVYSTTRWKLDEGQRFSRDAKLMLIAAVLGLVLALVISLIDYELLTKAWPLIGIGCIGLMVLTFLIGVAPDARPDSRCWLQFGGINFQTSELMKIGFIITFSMHLELLKDKINKLPSIILLGIHAIIPILLVIKTGDMGSALIFMIMAIGMLFFAGLHWGYFAAGIALIAAASPLVWMYGFSTYQKNRFLALIRPGDFSTESYQQLIGLNALGSGGFFGQGLFKGVYTQSGVVPESENDMIFAMIGEEAGFLGCVIVLVLLFLITLRIIKTAKKARDFSGQLICCGMAVMIASQVLINVGMCLMVLPVIGITLPFFSYGSSSILCIYIGIGLILSIYRYDYARSATNFRLSSISTPFSEY